MALAPGTGMGIKPPKPPVQTPAAALVEHIAMQSGQTPAQIAGIGQPAQAQDYFATPQGQASLASYSGAMPAYGQAPYLINKYLAGQDSPLEGLGGLFTKKAKKYGIDPRLMVAIAGAETSLGKDPNAAPLSEHNVWGLGPGLEYGNWKQGAESAAKTIANLMPKSGSIAELSKSYAPLKAANDPSGLNANWTKNVSTYYKQLTQTGGMPPGAHAVNLASKQLGQNYVWGGETRKEGGFDCSGLIQWAYSRMGIDLPRTAAEQRDAGKPISFKQLRPGDALVAKDGHHIVMYAGGGEVIAAPHTGTVVQRQPADLFMGNDWTARRFVKDNSKTGDWGYAGKGGAGKIEYNAWSRPATSADTQAQAAQEQNVQTGAAGGMLANAEMPDYRRKRKRSGRADQIDQLVQSLIQGQIGSQLI